MYKKKRMIMNDNKQLLAEVARVAEVAGYLWEKGWAERNGGNISVNVTRLVDEHYVKTSPASAPIRLKEPVPELSNHLFFVTGTGRRMRYVAKNPLDNCSLIRIITGGYAYEIISEPEILPTSELPAHLLMHNHLLMKGKNNRVVLHTHPTELIALTHCKPFLNSVSMTYMLWKMIPECRIIVPKGVGIVPYEIPGTVELARATAAQLDRHDLILWEKHGILAVGKDIIECFDAIDTLNKSAQIYMNVRMAGFEPEGLTVVQLEKLAESFGL